MQVPHDAELLRIFFGEDDRHGHVPLYEAIVLKAREMHLAGATVLRGAAGFGHSSVLHTAKILRLSQDLPIVIEIVDAEDKIVKEIPLVVDKPNSHRDTRRARKLANGHYLVCHELDGTVREYDDTGKVVWSYKLDLANRPATPGHKGHGTEVFNAIRLPDGNTLIAGGNNNRVIEVTPEGKVAWSIDHDELPGIKLAWVTSLQRRPNGNVIVGNTHAGPENPQLFEVTRDKKVVWTFKDFKTFGDDLCASQVINVEEGVVR